MKRSLLLLTLFLSLSQLAQAACTTSFMPTQGGGTPPRFFNCAAYADRPTSGLHAGDQLYAIATAAWYLASDATTWVVQVGATGAAGPTGATGPTGPTGPASAQLVRTVTVTLNSAQILTLNTNPIEILPAPSSEQANIIMGGAVKARFGTTPYSPVSLAILWQGTNQGAVFSNILDKTEDRDFLLHPGDFDDTSVLSSIYNGRAFIAYAEEQPTGGDGTLDITLLYYLKDSATNAIIPLYPADPTLSGSGSAGQLATWTDANTLGSVAKGAGAVQTLSFQPGLLSSIVNTKGVYGKSVKASTVDNIVGSAITFTTCTVNPTITMYECGTDVSCASPTTIGSVTITAEGQAFDGSLSNPAIDAGHYVGWAITAGSCAALDAAVTAQVHAN